MSTQAPAERHPLTVHLLSLAHPGREDRAALAALRRGLGKPPGTVVEMYPHVQPYVGDRPRRSYENACYIVAALFAAHPRDWGRREGEYGPTNFGASFARIKGNSGSIEKRFVALLECNSDSLGEHLRHAVSLLRAADVPVDWDQLLRDIPWWDAGERRVQRRWASAFWSDTDREAKEEATH